MNLKIRQLLIFHRLFLSLLTSVKFLSLFSGFSSKQPDSMYLGHNSFINSIAIVVCIAFFSCFVTPASASMWHDPYFDDGIKRASLVAIGKVQQIEGHKRRIILSSVFKGNVPAGTIVSVLQEEEPGHAHNDEEKAVGKEYLLVLLGSGVDYETFTPTFGLFPFVDSLCVLAP